MDLKRKFYYSLSPDLRLIIRRLIYLPEDALYFFLGHKSLMPPKGLIYTGTSDFKKIGKKFLHIFIDYCGLKPEDNVLDVGSGIGRMAIPLTSYLNENGSYEGFDIVKTGVNWCNKNINKRFPNFKFLHVDLKNELYNLSTEIEGKDFEFPYPDIRFDLVILTSVFTHMMPEDVENYLSEISRVLKPGGRCLMTFFILNEESKSSMFLNNGLIFSHIYENYRLLDNNVKEANIAFEERYLIDMFKENKLLIEKINYGYWSGKHKSQCWDFQDIIIVVKQ